MKTIFFKEDGQISIGGSNDETLNVEGDIVLHGNLELDGELIQGPFTINSNARFTQNVDVHGNLSIEQDLLFPCTDSEIVFNQLFFSDENSNIAYTNADVSKIEWVSQNGDRDKAFIVFQQNSGSYGLSGAENVRLTLGVLNNFDIGSSRRDVLDIQGGSELVLNAGPWAQDDELNDLVGSPLTQDDNQRIAFRIKNEQKGYFDKDGLFLTSAPQVVSDRNLKTDIQSLNNSLEKITALRGVSFSWKEEHRSPSVDIGLVAQEVEMLFPQAVVTGADGIKGIKYSNLIAPMIEAIKEQNEQIVALKQEIAELKDSK